MSCDNVSISSNFFLVFLLDHTLHTIINSHFQAQKQEQEKDFLLSQLHQDAFLVRPQQVKEEDEEFGCQGGVEEEDMRIQYGQGGDT